MLRIAISLLSLIFLGGCNMQRNMLYYPDHRMPSESELKASGLQFWPVAGRADYRGFISTREIENIKGTVIVFHGNAGTALDRDYYLPPLSLLGYRVILSEYPGYGGRSGEMGEESFVNDSRATFRMAQEVFGNPVYLLGESLGCGVVAGVANDLSLKIAGIVLITPWNTLLAVAKDLYPYLPVGWFMKDRYDNAQNLKPYQRRIAVVGAEWDEVIPVRHAKELFELLQAEKRMWTIEGVGHNDWIMRMDMAKWREIMDFAGGQGQLPR